MDSQTRDKIKSFIQEFSGNIINLSGNSLETIDCFDEIFDFYEKLKESCKRNWMEKSVILLDRHKIAACLALAIMHVLPIKKIDTRLQNQKRLYYAANETLASLTALYVLQHFIVYKDTEIRTDVKDKISQEGLLFPDVNSEDYILWLSSSFKECDVSDVNILLLSNILFYIEKYSILKYEYQIDVEGI